MRNLNAVNRIFLALALGALFALAAVMAYFTAESRLVYRTPYRNEVTGFCAAYGVEPALAYGVMKAESGFRAEAESGRGACGLMQITPATGEFIARKLDRPFAREDLFEPAVNIEYGVWYLSYLGKKFGEQEAIAAYNAGEGKVRAWLSDPACSSDGIRLFSIPYPETETYVRRVQKNIVKYRKYCG